MMQEPISNTSYNLSEIKNLYKTNWSSNISYNACGFHLPANTDEVCKIVRQSKSVKAIGSRHSFSQIADTEGQHICLLRLNDISIDCDHKSVRVGAGVTYVDLCRILHDKDFALKNLASLPHLSVVGACSTATHGSGEKNANLSQAVNKIEIVNANGELLILSRDKDKDLFNGAVVNLGALGIVTHMSLDLVEKYNMRQNVYENLAFEDFLNYFDDIQKLAYSVGCYTDWKSNNIHQIWLKSIVKDPDDFSPPSEIYGATAALKILHPINGFQVDGCTKQMGYVDAWHHILPHFHPDSTPGAGNELQSEYFIPRESANEAFKALNKIDKKHFEPLLISGIRTVAADSLWMSPCYKQDCVAIHFIWHNEPGKVTPAFKEIEQCLLPLKAKPHWAKMSLMDPLAIRCLYEKFDDFEELVKMCDPDGSLKFRNEYLAKYLRT